MKTLSALCLVVGLALEAGCGGGPNNSSSTGAGTEGSGAGSTTGGTGGNNNGSLSLVGGTYTDPGAPSGIFDGGLTFLQNPNLTVGNVVVQVGGNLSFATSPNPAIPDAGGFVIASLELSAPDGGPFVGTYASTDSTTCGGFEVTTALPASCGDINALESVASCPNGTLTPVQGSWTLTITSATESTTLPGAGVGYLTHGSLVTTLVCGASGDSCFQSSCVPNATLSLTF